VNLCRHGTLAEFWMLLREPDSFDCLYVGGFLAYRTEVCKIGRADVVSDFSFNPVQNIDVAIEDDDEEFVWLNVFCVMFAEDGERSEYSVRLSESQMGSAPFNPFDGSKLEIRIFGKYGAWGALISACAVRFALVVFISSLVMGLGVLVTLYLTRNKE
jgi:hypothetical protein